MAFHESGFDTEALWESVMRFRIPVTLPYGTGSGEKGCRIRVGDRAYIRGGRMGIAGSVGAALPS